MAIDAELTRRFRRTKRQETFYGVCTALLLAAFLLAVVAGASDASRLGFLVAAAFCLINSVTARVQLHGWLLATLLADYEHRRRTGRP